MPVVSFEYGRLEGLLTHHAKRPLPPREHILSALDEMGCPVDGPRDRADVSVEALMNRPDLFSPEGIARALVPFLRLGAAPEYVASPAKCELHIDPAVESVRPLMVAAIVRAVPLDDEGLAQLIDTQEKLDFTYGRRRTRASIGLHDVGALVPPFTYTARPPDSFSFTPLGADDMDGGARPLTMRQILKLHPKGVEYGHTIESADRYPLLIDSKGTVLSMPPIINGTATALTPGTRDVLIDVTGTAPGPVQASARLLSMLLADRGGTIESVTVQPAKGAATTEPDLRWSDRTLELAYARRLTGARLDAGEAAGALERMGHHVRLEPGGERLLVASPPWRFDLLHGADLVEDIAIGIGYGDLPGSLPAMPTIGRELANSSAVRRLRTCFIGLGFLELATLSLRDAAEEGAARGGPAEAARVANPVTLEHSVVRTRLLPSVLSVLQANTNRDLPQAVFEIADVVVAGRNETRVAAAYVGTDASFSRVKGLGAAVLACVGIEPTLTAGDGPPFLAGRAAAVSARGVELGRLGEIAPEVLASLGLGHPAGALEFRIPAIEQASRLAPSE